MLTSAHLDALLHNADTFLIEGRQVRCVCPERGLTAFNAPSVQDVTADNAWRHEVRRVPEADGLPSTHGEQ